MSRILFVHIRYPEFDRCSGDVRVCNLLHILSAQHAVALHVLYQQPEYLRLESNKIYADRMASLGLHTESGSLARHLRRRQYDVIVIEFWYVAHPIIQQIRALQPQARIIVDTEHIYFYSDQVRAAAIGTNESEARRARRKQVELATYRRADAIITTTDEDRDVVLAEDSSILSRTIPNIHAMPDSPVGNPHGRRDNSVIFVGNFRDNPSNSDAMIWFCSEIMPRLLHRVPAATLRVVGNMPPAEVVALQNAQITVTGYVPETAPYLDNSMVSVCPLRFGAGLKGKIGEAMAHGLPVVSTSVGIQGMQPRLGEEIEVADSPDAFADAIARVLGDERRWKRMSCAGRDFIEQHFGVAAVAQKVANTFGDLSWLPVKPVGAATRIAVAARIAASELLEVHFLWRWRHLLRSSHPK